MALSIKALVEQWEGVGVVMRYDQPTGTWIFIALHDDRRGRTGAGARMAGGTRMKVYSSAAAGLHDAMRLAQGMTSKWAAIDMDFGGGKCVLAVPRALKGEERRGLLRRYGRLLASLRGTFGTGVDLGTTPRDMLVIAEETEYVYGVDRATGTTIDPGPFTASGVLSGIRAVARLALGTRTLEGRVVHVQGVGDVGAPLARLLHAEGAKLMLSDLDSRRAERLAEELGGGVETFEPHTAYEAQCDIYAPCAVGATLNKESIPELKCRAVVGSANNQLEDPEDAQRLHDRGILYAPDYIVNAGGAIALAMMARGVKDAATIRARVDKIEESLADILLAAQARGESPVYAAQRVVAEKLRG